jgi:hypothetical protein
MVYSDEERVIKEIYWVDDHIRWRFRVKTIIKKLGSLEVNNVTWLVY